MHVKVLPSRNFVCVRQICVQCRPYHVFFFRKTNETLISSQPESLFWAHWCSPSSVLSQVYGLGYWRENGKLHGIPFDENTPTSHLTSADLTRLAPFEIGRSITVKIKVSTFF